VLVGRGQRLDLRDRLSQLCCRTMALKNGCQQFKSELGGFGTSRVYLGEARFLIISRQFGFDLDQTGRFVIVLFLFEMEERADALRRRIALYRRYLAEGVDADLAQTYLRDLSEAEAELSEIAEGTDKRE